MYKRSVVYGAGSAILVMLLLFTPLLANSIHLKGGAHSEPAFTDNGLTLTAAGALAGLGNADLRVTLTATAKVVATCTNPSGANQPPGNNPADVSVTGSQAIPASAIKNGNVDFNVTTNAPPTVVVGAPGCPNPNWTETVTDLAFTSAVLTVEQPVGTVGLVVTCTFNPATKNGSVASATVTCH